ncbi:electron transfer flavoprotein subunit alpha/FixB family protein [Peptoniphilus equinus]|uniref:Electron transfer flavoprotein subunit alpha/FixB family protein n=1 Tax=Peptoniphilus equinus TaxID=3016343 RepID=A0ABY7QW60_9FIRM|nr:electron transfer flavoprotein subunit alpha/FixB family protein [Peptoniphilus equinus]WBW50453.1 electron transfer flavoprotein subunit alpha/FixB family protein [Peptoniphilus equinus]
MKNILAVMEVTDKVTPLSLQILSRAREIADELDGRLDACLIGSDVAKFADELIAHGADRVLVAENPRLKDYLTLSYTKVFEAVVEASDPFGIMMPATHNLRDMGGRYAARKKIGLVAECVAVELNDTKDDIKWIRPTFDGQLFSDVRSQSIPKMGTVAEDVYEINEADANRKGEVVKVDVTLTDAECLTEILGSVKANTANSTLEDARVIVAGGLGLKEPKHWHLITELADALGAQTTGTKPISDQLWIPQDRYVGMSGRKVHPKVYIAIGISGSAQHIQGMKNSDIIIAINNDPTANIFDIAHYGIVGDLFEVVPKLTEAIKNL